MISTSIFPFIQEILEFQKKMTPSVTQCLKIAQKSRIQHCERSELGLHLSGQKFNKIPKNETFWVIFQTL